MSCIGSKVEGTLILLHLVGSFFDFIPARMGTEMNFIGISLFVLDECCVEIARAFSH